MKKYYFVNRDDGLKVVCSKNCLQGSSTSIDVMFVNKKQEIFKPVKILKSDLLSSETKFKQLFQEYDFDLSEEEIKKVVDIARESLAGDIGYESDGRDNLIDVIKNIYKQALLSPAEEIAFIRNNALYISAGCLTDLLKDTGWKNLEFKQWLMQLGLLNVNKNSKGYDLQVNKSRAQKREGKYTCIRLKNNANDMINIELAIIESEEEIAEAEMEGKEIA